MFNLVAAVAPRLRCVPLLAPAKWSVEMLAGLPLTVYEAGTEWQQLVELIAPLRQPGLPPITSQPLPNIASATTAPASVVGQLPLEPAELEDAPPELDPAGPLQFARVAVGGTFDRLHCGHELLLAATALFATERCFIGVTAEALLAKKKHAELLQSYEAREKGAIAYTQQVHPQLIVEAGPLKDPKEPTVAELDPDMQALVVSSETAHGGRLINAARRARGYRQLVLVIVPVVGVSRQGVKLSSTDLRQADAGDAADTTS